MSKRLITGLLVAALSLLAFGCDEDNNNNRPDKPKTGDECTVDTWTNTCKSADTRRICDGSKVVEEKCAEGYKCQKGECVEKPQPTVTCKNENEKPTCSPDGHYAVSCVGGIQQSDLCEFGCEQGACKTACSFTDKQCNYTNTAVTECQGGKIVVVEECPCNMGKCKETCSDKGTNKCNGDISVLCGMDGIVTETTCPNGCDSSTGICAERCQDGCSGKKLIKCKDGKLESETPCEYGCKDNRCLTQEEVGGGGSDPGSGENTGGGVITVTCDDDPVRCTLQNVLIVCDENGKETSTPCEYGCSNGKCNDASSAPSCNTPGDYCDTFGLNLLHCENGKLKTEGCEFGCSDGKCNDAAHAINCTEGASECANGDQMIMVCQNNKLEFNGCPYGCSNGKCNEKPAEKESCKGKTDTCAYRDGRWNLKKCVNDYYEEEVCEGSCVFNAYDKGEIKCVPKDYCTDDQKCKKLGKNSCDTEHFVCI